jgi:hypothetical protein
MIKYPLLIKLSLQASTDKYRDLLVNLSCNECPFDLVIFRESELVSYKYKFIYNFTEPNPDINRLEKLLEPFVSTTKRILDIIKILPKTTAKDIWRYKEDRDVRIYSYCQKNGVDYRSIMLKISLAQIVFDNVEFDNNLNIIHINSK